MSDIPALLRANAAFYDAFASHDIEAMDELWAHGVEVACIHPGWPPLYGRDEVMESWRSILLGGEAPQIVCDDPRATSFGASGLVSCYERIGDQILVASNTFVLQAGVWQIAHHQAGPLGAELEPDVEHTLN